MTALEIIRCRHASFHADKLNVTFFLPFTRCQSGMNEYLFIFLIYSYKYCTTNRIKLVITCLCGKHFEYRVICFACIIKSATKRFTKTDSKQEQLFSGCYCSDHDLCYSIGLTSWISWFENSVYMENDCSPRSIVTGQLDARSAWSDLWTASCTWHCVCYFFLFIDDQ